MTPPKNKLGALVDEQWNIKAKEILRANIAGRKTALYRHFDCNERLLYVGISLSAVGRLADHLHTAEWADYIDHIKIEKFPTRKLALDAEKNAIKTEKPLWNIVHNDELKSVRAIARERATENARTKAARTEALRKQEAALQAQKEFEDSLAAYKAEKAVKRTIKPTLVYKKGKGLQVKWKPTVPK